MCRFKFTILLREGSHHITECSADIASLICVVCLFIFCNALSLIINFIENFADMGQSMSYLVDISNFLVVLNSSVNFTIYMICGENFRQCFTNLFVCPFRPKKDKRRNGFHSTSSTNKRINKPSA
uniref:G-protein coupled receptors family 1 profile domain-containing protein n=1 Tax=Romanomermis culicivorax TaxID=13658 RepID=A0A915JQX4_ROMCU